MVSFNCVLFEKIGSDVHINESESVLVKEFNLLMLPIFYLTKKIALL